MSIKIVGKRADQNGGYFDATIADGLTTRAAADSATQRAVGAGWWDVSREGQPDTMVDRPIPYALREAEDPRLTAMAETACQYMESSRAWELSNNIAQMQAIEPCAGEDLQQAIFEAIVWRCDHFDLKVRDRSLCSDEMAKAWEAGK